MARALLSTSTEAPAGSLRLETVRHLPPELQRQVDAVARAAEAADGVPPFGEHKWLRLVRGDDRCAALLLWRGDEVVGSAHCDIYHTTMPGCPCRLSAEIVVRPDLRRRGLGTLLLRGVLALAAEEGADELHLWAYGDLPAARLVAESVRGVAERTLLQMLLPAETLTERVAMPPDVLLRPFEPARDAYAWLALHNRTFAGHPEQENWDAADLQARLEQPWFNARDLLLAEDRETGDLLGFCWVKLRQNSTAPGEIYIVGVAPEARGRKLGMLLTQAGLAHMRANGRPGAMLFVEADNAPAIALYQRLGFTTRWRHVLYSRRLSA